MIGVLHPQPSCPGLTRAFTTLFDCRQDVDGRVKPGYDEQGTL
jgi:hypothetical protein